MSADDVVSVKRSDLERCYQYAEIGLAAFKWAGITERLGHASPTGSRLYIPRPQGESGAAWFHDFMTWVETCERPDGMPVAGPELVR